MFVNDQRGVCVCSPGCFKGIFNDRMLPQPFNEAGDTQRFHHFCFANAVHRLVDHIPHIDAAGNDGSMACPFVLLVPTGNGEKRPQDRLEAFLNCPLIFDQAPIPQLKKRASPGKRNGLTTYLNLDLAILTEWTGPDSCNARIWYMVRLCLANGAI